MLDKWPLTKLFPGHNPHTVMIDSRDAKQFAKIMANKDRVTLNLAIFKTFPVLERQILTEISSFSPSLHKIGSSIVFAFCDGKSILFDTSYGTKRKDGSITLPGQFVFLVISPVSSPS